MFTRPPKQVLIYGPPAAGKLTVASELAARFEVTVLDNHLSIDPALRLFEFGTPEFAALVEEIRVALIRAGARAGRDVVTTLVYASGVDDDHVSRLREATTNEGGVVHFVQLRPPDTVLEHRVIGDSRVATSKISDTEVLREMLTVYDLTTLINDDDLTIDNTDLAADAVAVLIGQSFNLRPSPSRPSRTRDAATQSGSSRTDVTGPGAERSPVTLADGVVFLRRWRRSDAPFLSEASRDPAIERFNAPTPASIADAHSVIERIEDSWRSFETDGDPTGVAFAIVDAVSGEPVGMCGVDSWSNTDVAQFGYWLAAHARGRGLATRVVMLMTAWLFELGAARVFLTIQSENTASAAVARRAGYTFEGTLRGHGIWRGHRHDVDVFAVLPHEWPSARNR